MTRLGMIHGRFQPFHNGHLEYLQLAAQRCDSLIVGITNPDPFLVAAESTSRHRHEPGANPYTYFERMTMIREVIRESMEIPLDRVLFTPFPIHYPDRWRYYIPDDVIHFMRVFSPWEQTKANRLREHGYEVEVLQPGVVKSIDATAVREALAVGADWESLVPPAVARVVRGLGSRNER